MSGRVLAKVRGGWFLRDSFGCHVRLCKLTPDASAPELEREGSKAALVGKSMICLVYIVQIIGLGQMVDI